MRRTVAVDWDGTLVHQATQEWLPGSIAFVRACLAAGHDIYVHSSRANSPAGQQHIREKLQRAGLPIEIHPKPFADLYIDNQAHRFTGDYTGLYRHPDLHPRPGRANVS